MCSCVQKGLYGNMEETVAAWIITGMFVQIWRQIAVEEGWLKRDWIVKADTGTVFLYFSIFVKVVA